MADDEITPDMDHAGVTAVVGAVKGSDATKKAVSARHVELVSPDGELHGVVMLSRYMNPAFVKMNSNLFGRLVLSTDSTRALRNALNRMLGEG